MSKTFFFYDLETSGLNPRESRIMQFAGIRTDLDLNPIGEPVNMLVKLSDDILPSPEALMVTGITPQKTVDEGYSEAEISRVLANEVFTPDTIATGFNNIRFDDEFIRYLFWRNFFDPYEWTWKDGRSRWDLLDVVRMTRALRPEGINWPVDVVGMPTNRLELITKANDIDHFKAHDALSDVEALIATAKLIRSKQPQLYNYLFRMRDKNEIKKLINLDAKQPFVYVCGRYESEFNKATVVFPLTASKNNNVVVYDLRYDPTPFLNLDQTELANLFYATSEERKSKKLPKLPVKELQYNRAPAVAPLGVLSQSDSWDKIKLSQAIIEENRAKLLSVPSFADNVRSLFESRPEFKKSTDPEAQLYDGFLPDVDKMRVELVRSADDNQLADLHPNFVDERLEPLLLHYKAHNFPESLASDETVAWEKWRAAKLAANLPAYMTSLQHIAAQTTDENKLFILQELNLWAESIVPVDLID